MQEDYTNYANILNSTNAMYVDYDSTKNKLSSSRSYKWKNIISSIWYKKPLTIREIETSDPNKLVERFTLLLASKEAGNSGVNDEMIDIVNKLKNRLSPEEYKTMLGQAEAEVD